MAEDLAKLTELQVLEIRRLRVEEGLSQLTLARRFGISKPAISNIVAGRRWSWLKTTEAPDIQGAGR